MALVHYTVTLGAGATRAIATVLSTSLIRIENEASNAIVKYGNADVSATDYGGSVVANTATITNAVTLGPFPQGQMNLNDLWFLGTENQKIHLVVSTP